MRTLALVTVARSDFGIYSSLLRAILAADTVRLRLLVSGAHLSRPHGYTVAEIEAARLPIAHRVEALAEADTPHGIAESIARGVHGFANVFAIEPPDLLVVLGDRFDMFAAALAAVPFNIPIAHIHGGEVTGGAIDDGFRHSLTKLSHLHFTATEEHACRVRQLGEEPWRIHTVGAPALDGLEKAPLIERTVLEGRYGLDLSEPPLLVTFHPVTRQWQRAAAQMQELLAALHDSALPVIFTAPNADTHSSAIRDEIAQFVAVHPRARLVENFGQPYYFSMLRYALAMVGNSSSGIIEAATFELPVVDIGERQAGRTRAENVLPAACRRLEILATIKKAVSPAFRHGLRGMRNPYRRKQGDAAPAILEVLTSVPIDETLRLKRFCDPTLP